MACLMSVSAVNQLPGDQFEWMFGNVVELCTDAAVQVGKKRPFAILEDVCNAFGQYLDGLTENEKVVVLQLHPDLAGRVAAQGGLTTESTNEQRSAGLDRLTAEQKTLIDYNNEKYKAKFGFPFIICARENKIASIIEGLQRRYNHSRAQEILTGISEEAERTFYYSVGLACHFTKLWGGDHGWSDDVSAVNQLPGDQFEWMFRNVVELCTDAAVQVGKKRPFATLEDVCNAFGQYLDDLLENAQRRLSAESTNEQRSAGLDRLTVKEKILIDYNNEKYKAKFGFPFIIWARENKLASIIEGLQCRYNNSRAQEILTGISEVKKICALRIKDLVKEG